MFTGSSREGKKISYSDNLVAFLAIETPSLRLEYPIKHLKYGLVMSVLLL